MSRVLVTGAGGFIGSHVAELLAASGHDVRAFLRYNSRNDRGWLTRSPVLEKLELVHGDVRDFDSVYNAAKGCDAVFHLAALIGIPYSYVSPLAYVRTNVEGTYNVLESAKMLGLQQVIVTSTSETYGSAQRVPIDEDHPVVGQSPYSATKIAADQLAISYHRSFGLAVKVIRPFNTYGPRQSRRAIIPTIITQLLSGSATIRLGNTHPTRDLTFVADTAEAFLAVFRSPHTVGQVTNVGMNAEISMGELARSIARLMGRTVDIESEAQRVRPDLSEVQRLWCDNTRIMKLTDWRPRYTLESGLRETIEAFEREPVPADDTAYVV